jgi:hypothetical protein
MDTIQPHKRAQIAPPVDLSDLSKPFVMYVDDVAQLLRLKPETVRARCRRGTIQVKPRSRATRKGTLEWVSLDWWKYFNGKTK